MKPLIKVLMSAFATTFYERNALFFFLIIGIAGGFLSMKDHVVLASAIVSDPLLTLIPISLWVLYGLKINFYNSRLSDESQLRFVRSLALLPKLHQLLSIAPSILIQSLPMIMYGAFLTGVAFHSGQVSSGWIILLAMSTIPALLIISFYLKLNYPTREQHTGKLKLWIDAKIHRPFILFFPELAIGQKPGQIGISKLFSCLTIVGISSLYYFESYDYRFMAMGSLIAFAPMQILVFDYVHFENKTFSLTRSLPWSLPRRMTHFLLTMAVVAIPEVLVLFKYFPTSLSSIEYLSIIVLCFSSLVYGYTSLIFNKINLDRFSRAAFIYSLTIVVLILFKIPLFILTGIALAISAYRYTHFYSFELSGESKENHSALKRFSHSE